MLGLVSGRFTWDERKVIVKRPDSIYKYWTVIYVTEFEVTGMRSKYVGTNPSEIPLYVSNCSKYFSERCRGRGLCRPDWRFSR